MSNDARLHCTLSLYFNTASNGFLNYHFLKCVNVPPSFAGSSPGVGFLSSPCCTGQASSRAGCRDQEKIRAAAARVKTDRFAEQSTHFSACPNRLVEAERSACWYRSSSDFVTRLTPLSWRPLQAGEPDRVRPCAEYPEDVSAKPEPRVRLAFSRRKCAT